MEVQICLVAVEVNDLLKGLPIFILRGSGCGQNGR